MMSLIIYHYVHAHKRYLYLGVVNIIRVRARELVETDCQSSQQPSKLEEPVSNNFV